MKSGVEAAKGNNNVDPVCYEQMINQNQQQSHQQQLQMYERLLNRTANVTPRTARRRAGDQDTLGKLGGIEPAEIQMKRLDIVAQREQREFERSIEAGKEKRQSEMIKGITGAVTKALESPVVRELAGKWREPARPPCKPPARLIMFRHRPLDRFRPAARGSLRIHCHSSETGEIQQEDLTSSMRHRHEPGLSKMWSLVHPQGRNQQ